MHSDEQHAMSPHEMQSVLMLTVEFSKIYYTSKLYQLCHVSNKYRNEKQYVISFLSPILELYSEINVFRKPFGIGHIYIYIFCLE
jgi:hypothetical protein